MRYSAHARCWLARGAHARALSCTCPSVAHPQVATPNEAWSLPAGGRPIGDAGPASRGVCQAPPRARRGPQQQPLSDTTTRPPATTSNGQPKPNGSGDHRSHSPTCETGFDDWDSMRGGRSAARRPSTLQLQPSWTESTTTTTGEGQLAAVLSHSLATRGDEESFRLWGRPILQDLMVTRQLIP